MKRKSCVLFLSLGLLSTHVIAGTMDSDWFDTDWNWVGTLSLGPTWSYVKGYETFNPGTPAQQTYTLDRSDHALINGEIFVGQQSALSETVLGQFGAAVATTTDTTVSGLIWDNGQPQSNYSTYSYRIQHSHAGVKGKLLYYTDRGVAPWISASIAVGFNRSKNYSCTQPDDLSFSNPVYGNHTQVAFTYTAGFGFQKSLNENWHVGLGYEYSDWGSSRLGMANGQALGMSHVFTNGVMANLTYLT